MNRRAFTLVELLIVIAIIGVLMTLLLPSLAGAKRQARSSECFSQMHSIGMAFQFYEQDNNDNIPRSSHSAFALRVLQWGYALSPYLGHGIYTGPSATWDDLFNGMLRCPADARRDATAWSYGKNMWMEAGVGEILDIMGKRPSSSFTRVSYLPKPSATILLGELAGSANTDHIMALYWYSGGTPEVDAHRHGDVSHYLYVGGQVGTAKFEDTFEQTKKIDQWNPDTAQ
jgi:prepilin-type N-terminal cleavage/methylation domain-containing protein